MCQNVRSKGGDLMPQTFIACANVSIHQLPSAFLSLKRLGNSDRPENQIAKVAKIIKDNAVNERG